MPRASAVSLPSPVSATCPAGPPARSRALIGEAAWDDYERCAKSVEALTRSLRSEVGETALENDPTLLSRQQALAQIEARIAAQILQAAKARSPFVMAAGDLSTGQG